MQDKIEEHFDLKGNNTNLNTEIMAGITTFLATAYIIVVNPGILSTCIENVVCTGLDFGQLVTATVLVSAFSSIAMGVWAKNPYVMAPGMGLNAFFVWGVVITGVSASTALGAVFISGLIFVALSVANVRTEIVRAIPDQIRYAVAAGIGLFIAFIGFSNAGFIVDNPATKVGLVSLFPDDGSLIDRLLGADQSVVLFLIGLTVMAALVAKGVRGAFIIGIAVTTVLSILLGHSDMPSKVISNPDFGLINSMDVAGALKLSLLPVIFAFLFTDMFDSLSTFVGVAEAADGLKDENGDPRNIKESLIVDGLSTTISGLFGTSSGTTYIESAAGINQGGRSGLTAVVAGLLFIPFLWLTPLLEVVPAIATAPALVLVGVFMAKPVLKIRWDDFDVAFPAFMAMFLIPLTYSITQGIIWGFLSWTAIKVIKGNTNEVSPMLWAINAFAILALVYT